MSYEVHIQREDQSAISLAEWNRAIADTDGMRLATVDIAARNPKTGDVITIPRMDGDAEVYFPEYDAWIHCLRYSHLRISFRPPSDFVDPSSSFRRAVIDLASLLNAIVIGDGGEIYH